jgi:RNA polymerase-associated protein CTR9
MKISLSLMYFSALLLWMKAAPSSAGRRKRAWSESDEDEISERKPQSSLLRENSADLQDSDGEFRDKRQENAAADDED